MTSAWLTDSVTTDLDRAVHYTLLWGLDAIELRLLGEARVPHVNEEKLRRRLDESELSVASIQPGVFEGDLSDRAAWMNDVAMLPESLTFCRRTGCSTIVVSAFQEMSDASLERAVEAFRRLSDAAARADVQLAIVNENSGFVRTGQQLADLLEAVDRPNVAAAWSPVAAVESGEDPAEGLASLSNRVALVRCSDVMEKDGAWHHVPLGSGAIGWARQLELLASGGYDGIISFETFAEPRKKQAVRDATWLIRTWRAVSRR